MQKIFKFIGGIFKWIWKLINFIRLAVYNLFFLIILGMVYFSYTQTLQIIEKPKVKETSALVLNLSGPIVEQPHNISPMDSLAGSLSMGEMPKENVLFDIVDTIRYATTDDKISGLIISLKEMPETNLTKLRYIAKAINEFKQAGKPVYAVSDFYSQSQYYLASYADEVYLAPDGAVLLRGYGTYPLYYKTLLEKLNVTTHVFKAGTYKSAVEPFIRDDMSDEAKQAASAWLTQLWGAYIDDVANNRNIDTKSINPSMDEFLNHLKAADGNLAKLSQQLGLVDKLATRQQIRQDMATVFGQRGQDSYKAIGYYDYLNTINHGFAPAPANDDIAVIVASGNIMDGIQPQGMVGGDSTTALLRQAKNDSNVKAVVLRVNSPGGSAFASEVIRNEVEAIKAAGKPVVVSMSGLAASGGYWISMSADKIVAQPTTLTGSIGVFSVITTFEKGLNHIGVYNDGVGTTPFSGTGITRGISDQASEAFQLGVENTYQQFIQLVGKSRNMSVTEVDNIAQGRVWTGQDAINIGLVDQLGDFDDAVALAAKLADIEDYNIYWVQEPLSTIEQLLQDLTKGLKVSLGLDISSLLPHSLSPISEQIMADSELLNSLNDPKGYYSLCLTCQAE